MSYEQDIKCPHCEKKIAKSYNCEIRVWCKEKDCKSEVVLKTPAEIFCEIHEISIQAFAEACGIPVGLLRKSEGDL